YTEAGIYDVRVIATDKDGGISAPTHLNFWVYKAQVQGGDLYVGGSTGNDTITITKLANGQVNLVVNGEDLGSYFLGYTGAYGVGVILYAQAGNDNILLVGRDNGAGALVFPNSVALYGGDGDDVIDARPATDFVLLHGGAGNDVLWGGSGRNTLVGGLGADILHGGSGGNTPPCPTTPPGRDVPPPVAPT